MKLPIKDNVIPMDAQSLTLEQISNICINHLNELASKERDEMKRTTFAMSSFALTEWLND